jgi:hypothetical protein
MFSSRLVAQRFGKSSLNSVIIGDMIVEGCSWPVCKNESHLVAGNTGGNHIKLVTLK